MRDHKKFFKLNKIGYNYTYLEGFPIWSTSLAHFPHITYVLLWGLKEVLCKGMNGKQFHLKILKYEIVCKQKKKKNSDNKGAKIQWLN